MFTRATSSPIGANAGWPDVSIRALGAGLDGLLTVRDREARGDFALHALLGVDFLINPRWIIGADARAFWVTTHAQSPLHSFILTVAARVAVRFDLQ